MVKSTAAEMRALREQMFERDGWACIWPGCDQYRQRDAEDALQMAHLTHRGMGGSKERNTESNCITLCRQDHDVLDEIGSVG